jgi:hypothetical protein
MMETGEALMVPVVASALRNMSHFVLRPVDARWNYSGAIPKNLTGFNPLTFRVYLPEISFIAAYLGKGKCDEPLRPAWLDYELLYAVHDYIHVRVMEEAAAFFPSHLLDPDHRGARRLLLYCLCLSEVAATVGLDYWYLSRADMIKPLTTSYRANKSKSALDKSVLNKDFFRMVARLYLPPEVEFGKPALNNLLASEWWPRETRQARRFVSLMSESLQVSDKNQPQEDLGYLTRFADFINDWVWELFVDGNLSLLDPTANNVENPFYDYFNKVDRRFDPRNTNIRSRASLFSIVDGVTPPIDRVEFSYYAAQIISGLSWSSVSLTHSEFENIVSDADVQRLRELCKLGTFVGEEANPVDMLIFPN